MGLGTARKTYVVQDGGIALWNIFEDRFARCATGELDYYHASEHLHALADALFPAAEDAARRETWLRAVLDGLLALPGMTHKLVADAHLAALALEHGLVLCSADEDFRLFPGLRFENPLA